MSEHETLEQALRERYAQITANIKRDREEMAEFRETTGLTDTFEKRAYARFQDRIQREYHKRDELRLVAGRAGIKL